MDIIQRQSKLNPHSLQHILLLSLFFIFYINPCFIFNRKESKKIGQWLTSEIFQDFFYQFFILINNNYRTIRLWYIF